MTKRMFERALEMLKVAEIERSDGFHDLACASAEQALQLYIKGLLLKYFGIDAKDHNLGKLMGLLYKELLKASINADEIYDFVKENRSFLQMLEEAYYLGRYGSEEFDERDSEICLSVARKGIEVLEEVRRRLEGD